jgi:hypothetical protein
MSRIRTWKELSGVPYSPCEYELYKGKDLLRNGSSGNCQRRLREQMNAIPDATGFKIQLAKSPSQARDIEKAFCQRNKPPMNKRCG